MAGRRRPRRPPARTEAGTSGVDDASPTPEGVFDIDSGTARITADDDGTGWLIEVNGVQSSHIVTDDPLRLEFEYMRWIAAVIDDRHHPDDPLRVLHLGAGACTLARRLAAAYPRSRHVAVDVDAALATLVRERFDLPRAPVLRLRVGDAREVTTALLTDSRDIVIRDVFAGATTPENLTTAEFADEVHRVLRPGGLYLANCADTRDLAGARAEIATIGARFAHVALVADPAMLKGRRYGNIIIAASDDEIEVSAAVVKTLLAGAVPASMRDDTDTRRFAAGATVLRDPSRDDTEPDGDVSPTSPATPS
ncbi:spermidine synthase [Williamsia sp. Leaf354]|uniref:spermidine synthase n=1 Tax=Williamsia sp. Leaf354 TaxID=1736349 RepID=UPI000B1BE55D